MIATIKTTFNCPAGTAWKLLKKKETFLFITRGLLGFSGTQAWPEAFRSGLVINTRLIFFHILPAWRHVLKIIRLDAEKQELYSNESGGPVRAWNHLIRIEPVSSDQCRYMDEIDIRAGIFTPFIWGYAHLFYRYRQSRWKRLLRQQTGSAGNQLGESNPNLSKIG